jgi:signal transduction histidine kinase
MTTKALGMGMGLAISRSIVESHGGSLRMVQGVGSGANFAFDLPTDGPETSYHAG